MLSAHRVKPSKSLVDKYGSLEQEVQDWLDEVIGLAKVDMRITDPNKARSVKHPYVQFINKVQMHYTNADISCTALFSNRVRGFGKTITNREVLLNYPYPNTLAVIQISGEELKEALEQVAGYFSLNDQNEIIVNPKYVTPKPQYYNYDMYEGIDYTLDISKPVGERITQLEFNGKTVSPSDDFKLVTNQYRAVSGGNFSMFQNKPFIEEVSQPVNDLTRQYIKEHKELDFTVDYNFKVINGQD